MVRILLSVFVAVFAMAAAVAPAWAQPLRVVLVPADGGTADGTIADFRPLFTALARSSGETFDLRTGQNYATAVEALCAGAADVAFLGPVTFVQARARGCAELLAVAVENGGSSYYAGIFARSSAPIPSLAALRGKRVAFGDVNSASSFVFPAAMMIAAGVDPARDLAEVRMVGSHANSLTALLQGRVDAAALSFESLDRAVRAGLVRPSELQVVARSVAIPNPPFVVNARLSDATKRRLREAFAHVHDADGVTPDMIRGYGGKAVDRYDAAFSEKGFSVAARQMALVDETRKGEILRKAAQARR